MRAYEQVVGNIIAGILIVLVAVSILMSLFRLVFRDARGFGMYGGRGEFYMTE